jgi:hypothetical protein
VDSNRENRISTSEGRGRPTLAGMSATVETPTTLLASAGPSTATEMPETVQTPINHEFSQKFAKNSANSKNVVKKYTKVVKIAYFLSERFQSVQ